jgi:hypothetical protein
VGKLAVRYGVIAFVSGLLAAAGLAACTSSDATSSGVRNDAGVFGDASASDAGVANVDAAAGAFIPANGIVLVHAAAFPAFRVCFEGALGDLPQPSTDLLPESNLVGIDVGTAVRLPARPELLGKAFVFPEEKLRSLYPVFGGSGPSCQDLFDGSVKQYAVAVGEVTENLSSGVHALVLGGCLPLGDDPVASTDRCGADWNAASGNLKLTTLSLMAYARTGDTRLSVQLVQLSPALQRNAEGRALGLAFGPLEAGAPAPFVEGAVPFGKAVPNPPATLDYAAADIESYATSGVFVTLGGAVDDAGSPLPSEAGADASVVRQVVVAQSLAEIQKRSAPRSLPSDWFSAASSYVVLSVGDTDPRLGDGGPDSDPRRALHLLAIPLATPEPSDPDAGQ